MFEKEEKKVEAKSKSKKIKPKKDFKIRQNEFSYDLVKGEEIEIDLRFIENLKTEKVI